MRFWNKSLMARLVTYFLTLSAIGVLVTTLITLATVRNALTRSIYDRLEAVATLKEDEINRWVNDQRDEIAYLVAAPDLRADIQVLSNAEENSAKYVAAHDSILELLVEEGESHPSFREVFLMSGVGGKVLVSTEKGNEGQYRVSDSYYTEGRLDLYAQNVYTSPQTGQPAMTISAPLRDARGNLLGVLAVHINLERLDSIILQRAGLGETGETYMVDRFNNFISVARSGEREFPRGVHTQGIDAALRGEDGLALYTNYNGVPVIGGYRWVDERGTALLAEISQSEALAPVQRVATTILISGLAIVVILTLGVFLLARQIARPLLAINTAADQMAAGNLEARAPVLTEDEVGALAASFNAMSRQIQQLVGGLEQRVADRTKALATSTEVSRSLSTILDQKQLVTEVVEQLQSAFNYYHVHAYLLDETGENLVLAGGTGDAGKALLKRNHKLPRGRGLVGRAAETKEAVLVPDTSQDPDWLPNPLLPETKSEIAVPIIAGEQVLGVLDAQNNVAGSLGQQDADLIRSIANQLAVALQNARLYERAEASLQEAQSLVDYAPEAIVVVDLETGFFTDPNANAEKLYGLSRSELLKVGPAQMSPPNQPDGRDSTEKAMKKIGEAMQGGAPVFEWIHRNAQGQDIPCEVRLMRLPGAHPRVRASVTDITERKRLNEITIQHAKQQESLNLITQRIQSTTTVEAALQTAARELGHALGMKPTLVALDPAALAGERKGNVND